MATMPITKIPYSSIESCILHYLALCFQLRQHQWVQQIRRYLGYAPHSQPKPPHRIQNDFTVEVFDFVATLAKYVSPDGWQGLAFPPLPTSEIVKIQTNNLFLMNHPYLNELVSLNNLLDSNQIFSRLAALKPSQQDSDKLLLVDLCWNYLSLIQQRFMRFDKKQANLFAKKYLDRMERLDLFVRCYLNTPVHSSIFFFSYQYQQNQQTTDNTNQTPCFQFNDEGLSELLAGFNQIWVSLMTAINKENSQAKIHFIRVYPLTTLNSGTFQGLFFIEGMLGKGINGFDALNIQEIPTPWLKNLYTASDVTVSDVTTSTASDATANSIDSVQKLQDINKEIRKENKKHEGKLKGMLSSALVLDDILVLNLDWKKTKDHGLTQKHKKLFFSSSWEDKALQD